MSMAKCDFASLTDEEIAIVEGRRTGSADLTEDKTFASREA